MFNLLIQLHIERILSGGVPYIAHHPELGVPIGIFNTKDEPDYNSRVRNIKKIGKRGNKLSLLIANIFNIKNPLPAFLGDPETPEEMRELIKELKQANDKLRDSQTQYNNDLMDTADNWKGISEMISESGNVLAGYANMIQNTGQQMAAFTLNTRAQYEVAEKIAEQYKATALNLGLNTKQGAKLAETFKKASVFVERYGMDVADLKEIYSALADTSGRIQFLSTTELENLAMMTKAFKMSTQDAGEIADRFQMMGVNIEKGYEHLEDTFNDARAMGLNSQKVMDNLQQNFASMQRMSFRGGVKAMTQMAKLATDMRVSVSSMLGMAEKFYNPENAIEAAAELQLMGGDIAAAFGDPFETMYLARNKPEELAKRVQSMTENMVEFNEKTGEYTLPAEAQQQLSFMAEKLSLSKDEVIDMAYQTSKLKDVKEAFGTSTMFNDDEQSAIAQMAQFKDGEWKVTVGDEELSLDDAKLQQAVEDGMLIADDQEPMEKMVDASFTTNQLLTNILEEFKTGIAVKTDFYEVGERLLKKSVDEFSIGSKESIEKMAEEIAKAQQGEGGNIILKQIFSPGVQEQFGEQLGDMTKAAFKMVNATISGGGEGGILAELNKFKETIQNLNKVAGTEQPKRNKEGNPDPGDKDFLSRNDGRHSSFTSKDDVLGAMKGGVIDKLLTAALGNGTAGASNNTTTVNVNGSIDIKGKDGTIAKLSQDEVRKVVMRIMAGDDASGGKSSNQSAQYQST